MTTKKHYMVASMINLVIVLIGYIFPFMLTNIDVGNGMPWEQCLIAIILLLPSVMLWIKKPKALWMYSYLVALIAVLLMGLLSGDAISAGIMLLFFAVPMAIIYSILVTIKVVK